jgi:hypothetical protein
MQRVPGAEQTVPVVLVGVLPQQFCERPPHVPQEPFWQIPPLAVAPQSEPAATQRLETQQPLLAQLLP